MNRKYNIGVEPLKGLADTLGHPMAFFVEETYTVQHGTRDQDDSDKKRRAKCEYLARRFLGRTKEQTFMHKISTTPILLLLAVYAVFGAIAIFIHGPSIEALRAIVAIFLGALLAFCIAYFLDLLK